MTRLLATCLLLLPVWLIAQEDSTELAPYTLYKDRWILYSDIGYNSAPFTIHDDFLEGVEKLKFKHNLKARMGFGFKYKWLGLRLGFTLPGNLRPTSKYGNTRYFDLGVNFSVKSTYWDIDIRSYTGYAIKNAYEWNDTLTKLDPHLIVPSMRSVNGSINMWYIFNKDVNMHAVIGRVGHYNGEGRSWYLKSTLNFFGITNGDHPITPVELIDTATTKSSARTASAIDIGLVPGYAYANRIRNWQFSAFAGFGGVLQSKTFVADSIQRTFVGLAPRIDLRFIAGYNVSNYFVLFVSDFDIKSIRFQEVRYNQAYYNYKIVAGLRLNKKGSSKKKKRQQVLTSSI